MTETNAAQTSPRIVVLDGHASNPGDLSWDPLADLGKLTVHDRTAPGELAGRVGEAEVVLTNKCKLGASEMAAMPNLKYIGVLATGFNVIDVEAARAKDVVVTNVPAYSGDASAQHTMALLLELTNHVGHHARDSAERWPASPDFAYWDKPLVELAGLTMGVVGFGNIGRGVARRAKAFGMNVLCHTRTPSKYPDADVTFVELDELLAKSDVVSLHAPLTADTEHLIDAEALGKMKSSAILLNCGRGQLLDEQAVAQALKNGTIAAAGLDVLSAEPPPADHPLLGLDNCLVTPHQAWAAGAARQRLMDIATDNVRAFLAGEPKNVVS